MNNPSTKSLFSGRVFRNAGCHLLLIAGFIIYKQPAWAQQPAAADKIHIGLVYPLSSNGSHAARDTNRFSLNLIAGVSASEKGPAIAGLSNIIHKNATGVTIAGFSNHIGQQAGGVLIAGFLNNYNRGKGTAIAGFMNNSGDMNGVEFVGFLNISKNMEGFQMAGFANIARDVKGTQVSGFMNIARKVTGAQIAGFINIADDSDLPIGIINIIKNGEKSLGVTINEDATLMLSFRSGGKILYGIIGAGYNLKNDKEVYALEAGFGAHLMQTGLFRLNAELVASGLQSFHKGDYFKTSFRLMPAIKLSKSIELFGGPSLNYVSTDTAEGYELNKKYLHKFSSESNGDYQVLKIGYTAGLQVIF